ncbi:MAG: hypothetical protein GY754_26840 [bacterium]|nr:hypothetical protein [bacterium]
MKFFRTIYIVVILFFTAFALTSCNDLSLLTGSGSGSTPTDSGPDSGDFYSTTTLNYGGTIRYNGAAGSYEAVMAIDSSDNIISAAMVQDDFDLDGNGDTVGTAETSNLSSGVVDIILAKYSSNGTRQWVKRLEGNGMEISALGITVDSSDNIIMTGRLSGMADLNGDGDVLDDNESSGLGNLDAFVCKYSTSGSLLWSKRFGGANNDEGTSVSVDSSNNIYVTGTIMDNVDFNGDLDNDETGETASGIFGAMDMYILKMNSSGLYQWSKRLGGLSNKDKTYDIHVDKNSNVYICGELADDVDLSGNGIAADETGETDLTGFTNASDCFISSFDSSGAYRWSKRFGNYSTQLMEYATAVTSDSSGNIYITGFSDGGSYDLNGDGDCLDGTDETDPPGNKDSYIISFNTSGLFRWAKLPGGTVADISHDIGVDSDDNIFITGRVNSGTMDLNCDGDYDDGIAETGAGYNGNDIFVAIFNSSGTSINYARYGTDLEDQGVSLAVGSDFIVLGVYVTGDADLDGDPGTIESTSTDSNADILMVRYE